MRSIATSDSGRRGLANRGIGFKLLSVFTIVALVAIGVTVLALTRIATLRDQTRQQYFDSVVPLTKLDLLRQAHLSLRNNVTALGVQADPAAFTKQLAKVTTDEKALAAATTTYRAVATDQARRTRLDVFDTAVTAYEKLLHSKLIAVMATHDFVHIGEVRALMVPYAGVMSGQLDGLLTVEAQAAKARADQAAELARRSTLILVVALAVGLLLALGLALRIRTLMIRPLAEVSAMLRRMAAGDLTGEILVRSDDEVGRMATAAGEAAAAMRAAVVSISEATQVFAVATVAMSSSSRTIADSAELTSEQARLASEVAEAVSRSVHSIATGSDQMTASIGEIAANASEAARVGDDAVARACEADVHVHALGEASEHIDQVVKVISAIAEQTNLLALNATIESARAGEAGRGFAVVAGEVKELAQETARATDDIGTRVQAIQTGTATATAAIGQISEVVGRVNAHQTAIAGAVEEQNATTREIARSVQEAASAADRITGSMAAVSDAAGATNTAVVDAEHALADLAHLAEQLRTSVNHFTY
jgi:methyl-accepting chemotaxis protein